MSIKVMSEVWEHAPLTGADLLVLLALADMANDDRECWPGEKKLEAKARVGWRELHQILDDLQVQGIVIVEPRTRADGGTSSNLYKITSVEQWLVLSEYELSNTPSTGLRGNVVDTPPSTALRENPVDPPQPGYGENGRPPSTGLRGNVVEESSLNHHIEPSSLRPQRKKKENAIPASLMNPMKDAIVAAFDWKWETMTKTEVGQVQITAKELCEVGFEPERVQSLYVWCKAKFTNFGPRALSAHQAEWRTARLSQSEKPKGDPGAQAVLRGLTILNAPKGDE